MRPWMVLVAAIVLGTGLCTALAAMPAVGSAYRILFLRPNRSLPGKARCIVARGQHRAYDGDSVRRH
jgi:hypothetical protein